MKYQLAIYKSNKINAFEKQYACDTHNCNHQHHKFNQKKKKKKKDVDPQRDDDASPMPSYRCMSSSQLKIRTFFGKCFKFLGFRVVVLVKTFPLIYQLPM